MKYSSSNKPLYCPMTQSTWYKGTRTQTPVGILWHSTGANNPTLKRYVQPDDDASDKKYWLNLLGKNQYSNDMNHISREMGVNAWIGKLANGTVATVQVGPWNYRAWGCASGNKGSCNNGWIQFEICEDGLNDESYFNKIYKEACELTAYLCKMYNIDPYGSSKCGSTTVPNITCHQESYQYGCGSNHSDVLHWFPKYGKSMKNIRDDVAKLLGTEVSSGSPSEGIKVGDVVSIKSGAVWYDNGKTVPNWVLNLKWVVDEISGNRVVIDKSEDGKYSVNSPIDIKFLTKGSLSGSDTPSTSKGKEYKLVVDCNRYPSATDAANKTNAVGKYTKGTYYIYNKYPDGYKGMYNISTDSTGNSAGSWINPSENKLQESTQTIKVGDLVKLKAGAKYNGVDKEVPSWVFNVNWFVKSIDGNRVVLDKSEDGKNSIDSPFYLKDLILVSSTAKPPVEEEQPDTLYRVRITWEDEKSQIGAYSNLDSAKALADEHAKEGYKVFDSSGKVVYQPEIKEEPEEPDTPVEEPDEPVKEPEVVEYSTHTPIVEELPIANDLIVKVIKGIKENNKDFDEDIAKAFFSISLKYGIYPLYAISQSVLETGWFKFEGSSVSPEQHNYCGLGATGGGVAGASFDTIEQGVEAQLQHLYAYGCINELPEGTIVYDPRFNLVTRGKAKTWEELAGKWAVPGYETSQFNSLEEAIKASTIKNPVTYGHKILNIADRLADIEVTQEEIDKFYGVEIEEPTDEPDAPVNPPEEEEPDTPGEETPDVPDIDEPQKGDSWIVDLLKVIGRAIVNFFKWLFHIK